MRFREVRLIGNDGSQIGVVKSREALDQAYSQGLDLVTIAKEAEPPVCKIMDCGKYKYEEAQKEKERKKNQPKDSKEVKISPNIAEHDFMVMFRRAEEFLKTGHKVKVTCLFRAREIMHPELGDQKLKNMIQLLSEVSVVEKQPTLEGKVMGIVLSPKKS